MGVNGEWPVCLFRQCDFRFSFSGATEAYDPSHTKARMSAWSFFPWAWSCRSVNAADQSKGATHCYGATVRCYRAKAGGVVVPTLTIPKPSSRAVHPFRALGQRSPQTPHDSYSVYMPSSCLPQAFPTPHDFAPRV
jgi:hypothetical protein